ncbi:MAG: 2-oxoacid:ferredoxin oxidoreductase subunit beta [Candidatus Eisenbacteria bacterium]|nr:2-oxoacid:ferredoxin oxidoreductase subunit beta [Candidatus Eisenbacteria bacterium]
MELKELATDAANTWCPGCGNFAILTAFKSVLKSLVEEGAPVENFVMVAGIGCHAKIADYVNINSFYSIHGRVAPVAQGIKIANPGLKVVGFAGDGDAYGEGLEHLLFAAKRNVDFTMFIHNNRVYGLTTGQYTPTSPLGFKGRSTPRGTVESPVNPLELLLAAGAGFVGRAYSGRLDALKAIMKQAIQHPGFAVVDVLQVCATFFNVYDYYNQKVYELKDHDPTDFERACALAREWDYSSDAPIALGTFFRRETPRFEESFDRSELSETERSERLKRMLEPR